ncbi:MAG: DUF4296 domain-containing protein [Tannerella sp.]|nr:DUF4296 domain-containing protein [Tannerella sp.]
MAVSCSRVPNDVIPEKKMRRVLYDMQLAESMVEIDFEKYNRGEEKQKLYDAVFSKHKITQAKYDSSLIWYGENMDLYMAIYKLVLKDIEKSIAAMGNIKQDPLSGEVSTKDSLNIWIQGNTYTFKPEGMSTRLVFDIKPQMPYTNGSTYIIGFDVWGVLPSMRPKPRVKLSAVQGDTIITVIKEIAEDGYNETTLKTVEAKPVNRIFGYVFINSAENYHCVYLNDIQLMKYNKPLEADTALVVEELALEAK